MTSSRKPLTIDSNNTKVTEEIEAPVDVMNIMLVCDDFYPVTGHGSVPLVSTLFNSIKTQKDARLKKLLTAIVNGKPDIVEAMLKRDPSLLLEKLDKNDYITALSGQRCNNVTAYRTALAVEDTEIADLIKKELFKLTGNHDAADMQYHEQFPDGWEAIEMARWVPVFTMLDSLKSTIRDAKVSDISSSGDPEYKLTVREGSDVAVALAQFRSELNARLNEIVTTGRHFNPHLLSKAYQIYRDDFDDLIDSKDPRVMLFWQQIIGTIQRFLPVNYVQAFCHNTYETGEGLRTHKLQRRSLEFKLYDRRSNSWVSTDFYPLSASRLGFDYAIQATFVGMNFAVGAGLTCCYWTGQEINFSYLISMKEKYARRYLYPSSPETLKDVQSFEWLWM